ncbi:MAG: hypothetical protein V1777_02760 [Candidatus Micrarchaeota archaeon]
MVFARPYFNTKERLFLRVFTLENIYLGNHKYYIVIPLVMAVIAAFLAFVSPGLTTGLDIVGGSLLTVQTGQTVDAHALSDFLDQEFSLEEFKVTGTSQGVRIQFKEYSVFVQARQLVGDAENELIQDPQAAKEKAVQALELLRSKTQIQDFSTLSENQTVALARESLTNAQNQFNLDLQNAVLTFLNVSQENARFSFRTVGSALGNAFWQNAVNVVIIGLALVTLVIFLFFREFYPTLGILLAVVIDIIVALAGMALLAIPLSLTTLPALMMLIGYAVDTEILLSVRLFKTKSGGSNEDRTWDSFKTGMTMTATTLGTLFVMLVFSYYTQIMVIFEISAVLFFGLVGDVVTSWLLNAPMLLNHANHKKKVYA